MMDAAYTCPSRTLLVPTSTLSSAAAPPGSPPRGPPAPSPGAPLPFPSTSGECTDFELGCVGAH